MRRFVEGEKNSGWIYRKGRNRKVSVLLCLWRKQTKFVLILVLFNLESGSEFTERRTKDRRSELKGKVGGRLNVFYTLSMPNAYFTEQLVLRRLRRRLFGRGDRRGTEWFRLRKKETMADVVDLIHKAACRIRWMSKMKLSWPSGQDFVVYKSWDRSR